MPTSPAALARTSPRAPARRPDVVVTVLALIAGSAFVAWSMVLLADPARVELTVDNPTPYDMKVEVRSEDSGRLGLGTVRSGSAKSFALVIDQGERWLFEFSYGGVDAAPVEVTRDMIASGAVVVPDAVEEQFRRAGLDRPPS